MWYSSRSSGCLVVMDTNLLADSVNGVPHSEISRSATSSADGAHHLQMSVVDNSATQLPPSLEKSPPLHHSKNCRPPNRIMESGIHLYRYDFLLWCTPNRFISVEVSRHTDAPQLTISHSKRIIPSCQPGIP